MFFKIKDRSFVYLLLFPSVSVILGGLSFYWVEQVVDEPAITDMEDAFWLALATMSTVGYGEIYPQTTEGRIVATILLFAGILTFFGFLSTIASKLIKPTFEVKPKNILLEEREGENNYKDKRENKNPKGNDINQLLEKENTKEYLKEKINLIEKMDKNDFADLILQLTEYYKRNALENR